MNWRMFPSLAFFEKSPGFFTTRKFPGYSLFPYASCNLSFTVGESQKIVRKNRKAVASALGIAPEKLFLINQVHGDRVIVVGKTNPPSSMLDNPPEADAMICGEPGFVLAVMLADCVGITLYDPEMQVAGIVHSGWKGTYLNICGKVVDNMVKNWGCNPEKILAGISPAICGNCYEVSNEIASKFSHSNAFAIKRKNHKTFLDLPGIIRKQLIVHGICDKNIENPYICTYSNTHLWYSYRAECRTGRFILGILT